MELSQNEKTARRWYAEMWSKPDLDLADEIVDPGYAPDWIHIDATGPAQVKHEMRYFRSVFPDLKYEIVDSAGHGDRVWVRYRATGTQAGKAWGFEASGNQATFEGVTIFSFGPDGKIVDRWGAFCFYDLLHDLGLVPPLWELSQHLGSGKAA
jgi:hypothetical protein